MAQGAAATYEYVLLPAQRVLTKQFWRHNHPETIVYNVDASGALQNAIDQQLGKTTNPLVNIRDGSPLPPMPKRGDVDFIFGG
jgi:hypothetical protein